MIEIVNYGAQYSAEAGKISAECFWDSSFYAAYREAGEKGRTELAKLFVNSLEICSRTGVAKCALCDGKLAGFIMGFDYNALKNEHPEEFAYFFTDSYAEEQNDMLAEDNKLLDRAAQSSPRCAYLTIVAVAKAYRRRGIAATLVEQFLSAFSGYDVISDVISEHMEKLYMKYGFEKFETDAPNCTIYIRKLSSVK